MLSVCECGSVWVCPAVAPPPSERLSLQPQPWTVFVSFVQTAVCRGFGTSPPKDTADL